LWITILTSNVLLICIVDPLIKKTIITDINSKFVNLKSGSTILLKIWDTSGISQLQPFTSPYFEGAMGAILVYDLTK